MRASRTILALVFLLVMGCNSSGFHSSAEHMTDTGSESVKETDTSFDTNRNPDSVDLSDTSPSDTKHAGDSNTYEATDTGTDTNTDAYSGTDTDTVENTDSGIGTDAFYDTDTFYDIDTSVDTDTESFSISDSDPIICQQGLPNEATTVCCTTTCGVCGGTGCSSFPGGAENCCAGAIMAQQSYCDDSPPPCIIGSIPEDTDTETSYVHLPIRVFAGGVSGIEDLAETENSDQFREAGGGLYLHHSGWAPLSIDLKAAIETVFADRPVTVELGYLDDDFTTWQHAYTQLYHNRGIRPEIITLNAFSSDRVPELNHFQQTLQLYRELGVDESTHIFATFEYQNFPGNIPTLGNNKVSSREDFQQIIRTSGGLVIDTPSIVFFRREQNYRDWVIDAVHWSRQQSLLVGIIFSPNNAGSEYDEETLAYLEYLIQEDALPDFYFVENYTKADPATYLNIVGSEDVAHHQLGCARLIQGAVPSL